MAFWSTRYQYGEYWHAGACTLLPQYFGTGLDALVLEAVPILFAPFQPPMRSQNFASWRWNFFIPSFQSVWTPPAASRLHLVPPAHSGFIHPAQSGQQSSRGSWLAPDRQLLTVLQPAGSLLPEPHCQPSAHHRRGEHLPAGSASRPGHRCCRPLTGTEVSHWTVVHLVAI